MLPIAFCQGQIQFLKHSIQTVTTPFDVFVADIDQDGYPDILTANNDNGGEIRLNRNLGNKSFASRTVISNIGQARSVRSGDIDQDGDMDIIAAVFSNNQVSWWENTGDMQFSRHNIDNSFHGAHTVELCDLDKDGDTDVLCCEFDNSAAMSDVAWWENDGNQNWTKHVVTSRFQQATFVFGADMDNDGDNDLVACGELNGEVVWWKNDGMMNWTEIVIDNQLPKAHTILPRDFDKDGDLDILAHACTSGKQAWYENNGNGEFKKIAMEDLGGAIWLDMGDFDLDGDNDMIGTGMGVNNLVCYENDGRQRLSKQWLPGGLTSGFALNVADMDGDRDMDVVAIGYNSNTLAWWENISSKASALNSPKWISRNPETNQVFLANEEGSISVFNPDGWSQIIAGSQPICSGIICFQNQLWTNTGVELSSFSLESGIKTGAYRINAQFLCGLTRSEDNFFVSDPFSGTIIKINPESGENEVLVDGLSYPQAIRYDEFLQKIIVLDGELTLKVLVIDPETGSESLAIVTDIPAGGDIAGDNKGNYYLSSPEEGKIYVSTNSFSDEFILFQEGLNEPNGMTFNQEEESFLLIEAGIPTISNIAASATSNRIMNISDRNIKAYPNPCSGQLTLSNIPEDYEGEKLSLLSIDGKLVWDQTIRLTNPGGMMSVDFIDGSIGLKSGYYMMVVGRMNRPVQIQIQNN